MTAEMERYLRIRMQLTKRVVVEIDKAEEDEFLDKLNDEEVSLITFKREEGKTFLLVDIHKGTKLRGVKTITDVSSIFGEMYL